MCCSSSALIKNYEDNKAESQQKGIAGKWYKSQTDAYHENDHGLVIEFTKDGKVISYQSGVAVDTGTYTLNDNGLTYNMGNGKTGGLDCKAGETKLIINSPLPENPLVASPTLYKKAKSFFF